MKKLLTLVLLIPILFFSCKKETSNNQLSANDTSLLNSAAKTNSSAAHLSAQVATDWYKLQLRMMLNANPATNGALNANAFAYIGIGLYESVRSGIKNSVSLSSSLYQMPAMPVKDNNGYDLEVSGNATLASLIRSFYPWLTAANKSSVDSLENAWNGKLSLSMDSKKFQRSQDFGKSVAAAIYNWAKTDNYDVTNTAYTLPTSPLGIYIPTPPAFGKPILPFVSNSRPLLIADGSGVSPAPPFAYSENPSSDFYKMVKDIYDVSKALTTEQKNMALYWNDQGVGIGYTPQGHNLNVVTEAIEQAGADLGR